MSVHLTDPKCCGCCCFARSALQIWSLVLCGLMALSLFNFVAGVPGALYTGIGSDFEASKAEHYCTGQEGPRCELVCSDMCPDVADCSAAYDIIVPVQIAHFLQLIFVVASAMTYALGYVAGRGAAAGKHWCDCCCSAEQGYPSTVPPTPSKPASAIGMLKVYRVLLVLLVLLELIFAILLVSGSGGMARVWMARSLRYDDGSCDDDFVNATTLFFTIYGAASFVQVIIVALINGSLVVLTNGIIRRLLAPAVDADTL